MPPTPPPKTDNRRSHVSAEAAEDDDDERGEGESGSELSPVSLVGRSSPRKEGKRSEANMKARVEDEGGEKDTDPGEMEEVSL
jgi:hypothetical protein